MKTTTFIQASSLLSLALSALAAVGCSGDGSGGSGGKGGAGGGDEASTTYPDVAAIHELGVAPTCSLNKGVCHSERSYPELGAAKDMLTAVGSPCQLGAQDPATTLDQCEIAGDKLTLGGVDYEILVVTIAATEPFPPKNVDVELASMPSSLDATGATIRRALPGGGDAVMRPLDGVVVSAAAGANQITLALAGAADPTLATFLDVRAWSGDRVRMGDPNNNGKAHSSSDPWAEIVPGDPAKSLFYQRLVSADYGPMMPTLRRTWKAATTRAVWCWIRGMPKDAKIADLDLHDPIDYDSCPIDPDAPDPNAPGGWPAVRTLMQSKCATGPCHTSTVKAADLDLTGDPAVFAEQVINASSTQKPGTLRVAPGQPAASYLLCKVDPACAAIADGTALMPLNSELTADEIKTISDWILNGAPTE